MPPGMLRGELYLAYVHSQTNPQTCTKFGANRSSCLRASQDFLICDPLKPTGVLRGELYLAYVHSQTNPQICTKCRANRSSRLTASPNIWICDSLTPPPPPKCPWRSVWRIVFSLYPFSDESADVYQIWCQSMQPFDSFPIHLNLWPPNSPPPQMPPGVLRGDLYLAYAHYQMNPLTWTKVGANRSSRLTASQDFWMFDP